MKKAIAYVDKAELFVALKIPYGLSVIAMEYPCKDGKMKITLKGDRLPVDHLPTKTARKFPEVSYEMRGTWHQARVEAIEVEEPEPVEENEFENKNHLMKSPFDESGKYEPPKIEEKLDKKEEIIEKDIKEDQNNGKKRRKTKNSKRN
ncbi:MAG: hypothetical protein ACQ9MH_17340 [Nitrospinales bacterium]